LAEPLDIHDRALRATLPFAIVQEFGLACGYERSAKFSAGKILANRYLLGIPAAELTVEKLTAICRRLAMPEQRLAALLTMFADANLVFLGCEDDEGDVTYKVYAELYERCVEKVHAEHCTEPLLTHFGVKWRPDQNDDGRVANYLWQPGVTPAVLRQRIEDTYQGVGAPSRAFATAVAERALLRSPNFIYLEVEEPPSPRRSFDLNIYASELRVVDVLDLLQRTASAYAISRSEFERLAATISHLKLGHVSGGIDRAGADFSTIYYEANTAS
jgi:hypothetical protein